MVGQDKAIESILSVMEKVLAKTNDTSKVLGTLMFLGPTGTGKTSLVEALAESLFGRARDMVKIDCGEYQHSHEIAKLVGSPPGYLGHRETSPAINRARLEMYRTEAYNFTIVLFDEIEKSSDALWNLLLSILDKGTLTLGTNEVVDMSKCLVVLTSNVGSKELAKMTYDKLGFTTLKEDVPVNQKEFEEVALAALRKKFTPEFINRVDDIVIFETLTKDHIEKILQIEISRVKERLAENFHFVGINLSPSAIKQLIKEGYDSRYNARNLKRAIERVVVDPITRMLNSGELLLGENLVLDYREDEWEYWAQSPTEAMRRPTLEQLMKEPFDEPRNSD